jgi:hypothetical protein
MKQIYFKKIKGRINKKPLSFALLVKNEVLERDEKGYILKHLKPIEYKRFLTFLKTYIFNAISSDDKKKEIYMPKDYILKVNDVEDE